MDLLTLTLFVPACFALNMIPGPNNLLSMANGQRYGFSAAMMAGLGRLAAFVVMIALAATGLAAVLYASETLFFTIKVVGALYLFWTAFQLWCAPVATVQATTSAGRTGFQLARQEFLLAAGNPKAILIFTAFLPQFVDPAGDPSAQFMVLGAGFLCLEWIAIAFYAGCGIFLRHWFANPRMRRWFNRSCAVMIGALGIGMLTESRR